jgi:ParB family chromosome partitioning protein
MAGLSLVPAVVRELDDEQITAISLVENLQRDDLNPLEEADGYHQLMTRFSLTQAEVALRVGRSRPAVANALRLLSLPDPVREMIADGRLSAGHARCLAGLEDPVLQCALAERRWKKAFRFARWRRSAAVKKYGKRFPNRHPAIRPWPSSPT